MLDPRAVSRLASSVIVRANRRPPLVRRPALEERLQRALDQPPRGLGGRPRVDRGDVAAPTGVPLDEPGTQHPRRSTEASRQQDEQIPLRHLATERGDAEPIAPYQPSAEPF